MSALNFINPARIETPTQAVQVPAADFFDVVSASFESTSDNYIVGAKSRLVGNFTKDRDDKYINLTGREIYNDAMRLVKDQEAIYNPKTGILNKEHPMMVDAVNRLITEIRDEGFFGDEVLNNSFEIEKQAQERARASLEAYNKTAVGAGEGLSTTAASLLGGVGASFMDPINLATLPIGASAGYGLFKTVLFEAGLNAGVEAASQPIVAEWQNEIGNQYGFTEAAENVAIAALFGGGVGALTKGAQLSYTHFFDQASRELRAIKELDASLSAKILERETHIDQSNVSRIVKDDVQVEYSRNRASMDEVNQALIDGRKIEPDNIKVRDEEILEMDPNKVEPAMRSTVQRYQEPPAPEGKLTQPEDINEALDFDEPLQANLKNQQELENIFDAEDSIKREADEFENLKSIRVGEEDVKVLGDTDGDDFTLAQLKEQFKADDDYLEALRVCGL